MKSFESLTFVPPMFVVRFGNFSSRRRPCSLRRETDVVLFRVLFGIGAGGDLEGEFSALGEAVRPYLRDARGDGDGLYVGQAAEATRAYARHAFGDHDGFQGRRRFGENIGIDPLHRIGNKQIHFAAVEHVGEIHALQNNHPVLVLQALAVDEGAFAQCGVFIPECDFFQPCTQAEGQRPDGFQRLGEIQFDQLLTAVERSDADRLQGFWESDLRDQRAVGKRGVFDRLQGIGKADSPQLRAVGKG